MTNIDHLVEQNIIEHESRLKHIDELIDQAHSQINADSVSTDLKKELKDIRAARAELETELNHIKLKNWQYETIENAGPMGLWDVVAQRIEKLVEHLDKK